MLNSPTTNSDNAARVNIITRRGDTFTRRFLFQQVINGTKTPEDLTGSTFKMAIICRGDCNKTPIIDLLPEDFGTPAPGTIEIIRTATEMQIFPGRYWYDLQQTYPDGTVKTRLTGDFIINNDVTQ